MKVKKSYTALYLPDPHSHFTKSGFKTIKAANAYIYTNKTKIGLERQDWLVVDTDILHKHLDYLEVPTLNIHAPSFQLECNE